MADADMHMYLPCVGDFSFSRSLVVQYGCRNVLATCYDSEESLHKKYPQAEGNIQDILLGGKDRLHRNPAEDGNGDSTSTNDDGDTHNRKVLYSVDARKLGLVGGGGKMVRKGFGSTRRGGMDASSGAWDVICFNFPHVGGLSTDVNRQVRSNQELLVAFFKACIPLLSLPSPPSEEGEEDYPPSDDDDDSQIRRTQPGQVIVTLFENEPYTLWNIKDLARHAGLRVITSFSFPWSSYNGYSHARTIGQIEGKHGGTGGWKGEDRLARMYVFDKPTHGGHSPTEEKPGGKRKRRRSTSDSSDSGG